VIVPQEDEERSNKLSLNRGIVMPSKNIGTKVVKEDDQQEEEVLENPTLSMPVQSLPSSIERKPFKEIRGSELVPALQL
jgi:hypothetical protein